MNLSTEVKMSTTLPTTAAGEITLYDTFVGLMGTTLAAAGVERIVFAVKNSHACTLRVYESKDGTTYRQIFGDISVGVPAATDLSGPFDWLVEPYRYAKVTVQSGASDQTTWEAYMRLEPRRMAAV